MVEATTDQVIALQEREDAIRERIGGLREILELDFSGVGGPPDKYDVRKLKGRDLKSFRQIVLSAMSKMREIQDEAAKIDAQNEPARGTIRAAVEANERRGDKDQDPLPLPDVTIIPDTNPGLAIGQMILGDVLDELILDDDSWLAPLVDEDEPFDELDLDWYLCVIERVVERDDFPNLLARHLRIYQVFSNALRTKSASDTGTPS